MLLLTVLASMLLAEKWIYEMETITIPVGEEEHELYIYDSPDHLEDAPDFGPTKFVVDNEENYYIPNLIRKRGLFIKKFDSNGNYLSSIKINDGIVDIAFCNDTLYVLNIYSHRNNRDKTYYLQIFSNEFVLIDSLIFQNEIIAIGDKLISNNQGEIGISRSGSLEKIKLEKKEAVLLENSDLFDNITMRYDRKKRERIVFFKDTNKEVNLYEFWDVSYHNFLNIDNYKNMYFELWDWDRNSIPEIVILSNKGNSISTNILIEDYTLFGLQFLGNPEKVARKDGSLYQLVPMKDRIEIRKWHKVGEEK